MSPSKQNQQLLSVIVPTINRKSELAALLESLSYADCSRIEVIIADQNPPGFLDEVLEAFRDKFDRLEHLLLTERGAARARNSGATHAKGDILCFPDDDSRFLESTVGIAMSVLADNEGLGVIFGKTVDEDGNDSVIRFHSSAQELHRGNLAGGFVEATMFVRKEVFEETNFDESFGVGTFYGAEEAYDLLLRMLEKGVRIHFDPTIQFYHPHKVTNHTSPAEIRRVFQYRCGFSHLCRKHRLYGKWLKQFILVSGYCFLLLFSRPSRVRYYVAEILGLLTGLIA